MLLQIIIKLLFEKNISLQFLHGVKFLKKMLQHSFAIQTKRSLIL